MEIVMKAALETLRQVAGIGFLAGATLWTAAPLAAGEQDISQQIFNTMIQVPGANPAFRTAHAKGIVCQGTFTPSKEAASLSKAAHFKGSAVPITVRFSDASQDPFVPDNSDQPRGMAMRFAIPGDSRC
jgi:catalase